MKQRLVGLGVLPLVIACVFITMRASFAEVPGSTAFLRDLTSRTTVSRGDCMRAAAALVAGLRAPVDDAAVAQLLRERHVVRGAEAREPERLGTRGFASLLFARALGEGGGVMRHILPSSEHYAYRHLNFLDMVPAGGSGRPITGLELVSLLGLSRKRMARHQAVPEVAR